MWPCLRCGDTRCSAWAAMDRNSLSLANLTLVSLSIAACFLFLWLSPSSPSSFKPFLPRQKPVTVQATAICGSTTTDTGDDLEDALRKASMPNKTVIITVVNGAYVDQSVDESLDKTMFDLFVESLWLGDGTRGLLDHVLVVAMDRTAHARCIFLRLNCYRLETAGVDFSGETYFMSQDFLKMMWSRTLFLGDVLKHGYNFIFTDTDVMWLRNPFTKLSTAASEDLQISTDTFNGNPWSENNLNYINTGFYFVRSNYKTIALFDEWYARRLNSTGMKEQDALSALMHDHVIKRLAINVRFLDTLFFSGFCHDSNDLGQVATVHANCCRSISAKIFDLTVVLREWKGFKRSWETAAAINNGTAANATTSATATSDFRFSPHFKCRESWRTGP